MLIFFSRARWHGPQPTLAELVRAKLFSSSYPETHSALSRDVGWEFEHLDGLLGQSMRIIITIITILFGLFVFSIHCALHLLHLIHSSWFPNNLTAGSNLVYSLPSTLKCKGLDPL